MKREAAAKLKLQQSRWRRTTATTQSARQALLLELKRKHDVRLSHRKRGSGRYLPDCRIALSGESADTHLSKSAVPLYCQAGTRLQRQRVARSERTIIL